MARIGAAVAVADEDNLACFVDESVNVVEGAYVGKLPKTYVCYMSRVMGGTGGAHDYLINHL